MLRDLHGQAVAAARDLIALRASEGRHHVAATVLTRTGGSYTAVNTDSVLGRAAVCAEAVAIGMACSAESAAEVVFVGAVNRRLVVIPPCGLCRELLLDYGPDARVAVPEGAGDGGNWTVVPLAELFPHVYKAGERAFREGA